MFIKASLALLLMVVVGGQAQCTDNTFICSDCTELVACFGGAEYPITCTAGQVCGNNGADPNIDGCFDISDSSNTKQSQCSCDASATNPTYMADGLSEDPAAYLACLPGSSVPESLSCTAPEIFIEGQADPCGAAPPTTTAGPTEPPTTTPEPFACTTTGFSRDDNSCSKYWLCDSDTDATPTEANCPAGESFNEATLSCMDPCDSSAATFSCDGIINGAVVDSIDCSVFHICVGGVEVGVPVPCPDTEIFDETANGCVTGTCPAADECLVCQTTVAPTTVSGATPAGPGASPTDDSGSSNGGSGSSPDDTGSSESSTVSGPDTPTDVTTSDSKSSTASDPDSSPEVTTPDSGVTGVPDCSSASQEGYYESATCNNLFYSCEDDDEGGFVLKEYTCPGSLVFDGVNNYCNLATLVTGC